MDSEVIRCHLNKVHIQYFSRTKTNLKVRSEFVCLDSASLNEAAEAEVALLQLLRVDRLPIPSISQNRRDGSVK